ncbi:hypothetical protein CPAR01_08977 [Colletotrichum paranaense]|uniref:Uncharacterized protein n=1 Tax=Colletotrichum paranaense TaxID=1914294 RepID=A0ABQ9SFF5_9PEZI|nr:uncharacterized protein CPAR01_08977 [Colletotrichum paranaense]KAK1535435.1 hypothetical protein CPAR01_08977 [Colletotrichum paranaense]
MEQDDQELTRALGQAAGRMDHGDLEESDTPGGQEGGGVAPLIGKGCVHNAHVLALDLPPLSVRITLRSILIMALMPQMRFHCESGGDIGWWCGGSSLDFQATSEPRPSVFQHFINTELIGQQHLTVAAVLLLFSSCFYASTFLPSPPPGEAPLSVRSDDKMQSGIRRLGCAGPSPAVGWFAGV